MRRAERCIRGALLDEVFTTPKPGLVDCHDTGAHRDMDVDTFTASADAVTPYILQMFYIGWENAFSLEKLFAGIRIPGRQAEKAMFQATGGVNTHKGIIFTMGILAAACGACLHRRGRIIREEVFAISREMTEETLQRELQEMRERTPETHGEILYQKYGETGIRGEAMQGFPILKNIACPYVVYYRRMLYNPNLSQINVLLHIMTALDDTNVLSRGSRQDLYWLKEESRRILRAGGAFTVQGYRMVQELNTACIARNISPGGAADMLAAALFLCGMEQSFNGTAFVWQENRKNNF